MIEYTAITVIVLSQLGLYLWMDTRSYKLSKIWVLLGFMIAQTFLFPQLVISIYGLNDLQCGMPTVALHFFFLLFGGGSNLIAHLTYYLIKHTELKHRL